VLEGSRVKQILLRNENLKQMCCRNDLSYTAASCLTENRTSKQILECQLKIKYQYNIFERVPVCSGGSRGGTPGTCPPPPSKIGKNKIFWSIIMIFHTKYPKNFHASLHNWKKYDFLV
jgi:hypothetical protein